MKNTQSTILTYVKRQQYTNKRIVSKIELNNLYNEEQLTKLCRKNNVIYLKHIYCGTN